MEEVAPPKPVKPKRALGGFELYAKHIAFTDARLSGECMNVVGFTSDWRDEQYQRFLTLPDEEKNFWDGLSKASKHEQKAVRRQYLFDLSEWKRVHSEIDGARILQSSDLNKPSHPLEVCCVCGGEFDDHWGGSPLDGMQGLREESAPCTSLQYANERVASSESAVPVCKAVHARTVRGSHSRMAFADEFKKKMCAPACDRQGVPHNVRYLRTCGPICVQAPQPLRFLEARLRHYWSSLVKTTPGPSDSIALAHIFLRHTVGGLGAKTRFIVSLDNAKQAAGPHLATQVWTLYQEIYLVEQGVTVLNPLENPFIKTQADCKHDDEIMGGLGSYKHYSEQETTEKSIIKYKYTK